MLGQSMVLPTTKGNGSTEPAAKFSTVATPRTRRARAWFEDRLQQARKSVVSEVVELDPVLAEILLEYNDGNRALSQSKVEQMAADIKSGRWELNGESLKVAVTGQLNDGQHRAHAVVTAATPIKTMMIFGLPRESRMTVDQGKVRTVGDYLGMGNVPDANNAASVATLIWRMANTGNLSKRGGAGPTKAEIRELYYTNTDIDDSVRAVGKKGATILASKSLLAFCHFMLSRKDRRAADAFFGKLIRGDELKVSDPIYVARQKLIQDGRLKPPERVEIVFRAWNAAREGRTLRVIPVHGRLPSIER